LTVTLKMRRFVGREPVGSRARLRASLFPLRRPSTVTTPVASLLNVAVP